MFRLSNSLHVAVGRDVHCMKYDWTVAMTEFIKMVHPTMDSLECQPASLHFTLSKMNLKDLESVLDRHRKAQVNG